MLKVDTHAALIKEIDNRKHTYYCANNSTLGEIFDVLTEMRAYIAQRIEEEIKREKSNKESPKEV